jgi:trehalose-phosphatase
LFRGIPRRIWRLIALAHRRLLMLDHDGTLAPFETMRDRAVPPERSMQDLQRIATSNGTRLAIVSGRPVRELEPHLGKLGVTLVGEHGWEHRAPGEDVVRHRVPDAARRALDEADRAVMDRALRARLEVKRTSIALHTRGLEYEQAEQAGRTVRAAWRPHEANGVLRTVPFAGGFELRVAGRDKGVAVRSLLEHEPAETLAVYVGDDLTDEDAFEAVRERGFGLRVGDPGAVTHATAWLDDPGEVGEFLAEWLSVTGMGGAPAA